MYFSIFCLRSLRFTCNRNYKGKHHTFFKTWLLFCLQLNSQFKLITIKAVTLMFSSGMDYKLTNSTRNILFPLNGHIQREI